VHGTVDHTVNMKYNAFILYILNSQRFFTYTHTTLFWSKPVFQRRKF